MADIAAIASIVGLTMLYILEIWINVQNQRRVSDMEIACYYLACRMGEHGLLADSDPLQAKAKEEASK